MQAKKRIRSDDHVVWPSVLVAPLGIAKLSPPGSRALLFADTFLCQLHELAETQAIRQIRGRLPLQI